MVGPGPAAFYADACRLVASLDPMQASTHLISHLLREIESALRDVLVPISEKDADSGEVEIHDDNGGHRRQIRAILKALDLTVDDPAASSWLGLAGRYPRWAHRDRLSSPRPLDEEFQRFWDENEAVLDVILERFETRYLKVISTLDRFIGLGHPTEGDAKRLAEEVPNSPVARGYFFDQLNDNEWLAPLASVGMFSVPQPATKNEDEGTIAFPAWPASRFLARVAPKAPKDVIEIALQIKTDNASVQTDLVEAALGMPPHLAARMVPQVEEWLEQPYMLLPERSARLVSHLVRGKELEAAIHLARALLHILPGQRRQPREGQPESALPPDPRPRIDHWEFQQALQGIVPQLAADAPEETLSLLCDLLETYLELAKPRNGREYEDLSALWRPAIEPHEQNSGFRAGAADLLIDAVRSTAEEMIRNAPEALRRIVTQLDARKWTSLRRVALHLLAEFGSSDLALVGTTLGERGLFSDASLHHEYWRLARLYFSSVDWGQRELILAWIEEGPDLTGYSRRALEESGQEPSAQDLQAQKEYWQIRRLSMVKDGLDELRSRSLVELIEKRGEVEHPDLLSWSSGVRSGPTSPLEPGQMLAMSSEELANFLRGWTAPSDLVGMDSAEGLSRALIESVRLDPARLAREAGSFKGLHSTYVRGLLAGWKEATKEGVEFEWGEVLTLCEWAIAQPRSSGEQGRSRPGDFDPDWGWARKQVAALLESGLQVGSKVPIPFGLKEIVTRVLGALVEDPDPTAEYEAEYGGTNMDPATLSLNTTRGQAFHALFRYAVWYRRHSLGHDGPPSEGYWNLRDVPHLQELLDRHLDTHAEGSMTVRAVFGWYFGVLLDLDPEWALSRRKMIFPHEPEATLFWQSAWDAFVRFNPPSPRYLSALEDDYRLALARSKVDPAKSTGVWSGDPSEKLVAHLLTYYCLGEIELESELMVPIVQGPSSALRKSAIMSAGQSLMRERAAIPENVAERLMRLFEEWVSGDSSTPLLELAYFGYWFSSGRLPDAWSLAQLRRVILVAGTPEPLHMVADRLSTLAHEYPAEVIDLLGSIIAADKDGFTILKLRGPARSMIETVLGSEDELARDAARDLVNRLAAKGSLEFKDLLGPA